MPPGLVDDAKRQVKIAWSRFRTGFTPDSGMAETASRNGVGESILVEVNSLFVMCPYRYEGMWVFDDPAVGLVREPFVSGIDAMIDKLVARIENADKGFRLIFSPAPFPGYSVKLEWRRSEYGGNWYYWPDQQMEGWLCPALFKYFKEPPKELYARAEPKAS